MFKTSIVKSFLGLVAENMMNPDVDKSKYDKQFIDQVSDILPDIKEKNMSGTYREDIERFNNVLQNKQKLNKLFDRVSILTEDVNMNAKNMKAKDVQGAFRELTKDIKDVKKKSWMKKNIIKQIGNHLKNKSEQEIKRFVDTQIKS